MNVTLGDPDRNLRKFKKLLDLSDTNSDIILLPELWSSGYDYENFSTLAGTTPSMLKEMSQIAQQKKSYIGGSLIEYADHKFYNTFFLINPNGDKVAAYRKIHLFSLMDEDKYFSPGNTPCLIKIHNLTVGLITCYDIRFPELSRKLALEGAELLLICAQWPKPRTSHWRTLLKARAIENQLHIAACNRIGKGVENHYPGNSAIYDPWGKPALKTPPKQGVFTATIDLRAVAQIRGHIDCFNDRRPNLY